MSTAWKSWQRDRAEVFAGQGMNVPDPHVDQVGVGCGGRIHDAAMLPDQSPGVAFALGLKCSRARGTDRQLNRILFLFATGRQEIIFDVKIFLDSKARHKLISL
jgi:hypothetical protein